MLGSGSRQGLERNNHQGKFGADYVRVLASAAGLLWSQDDIDMDGVDLCLKLPGRTPRGFSPRIDVQVKTVSKLSLGAGMLEFDGLNRRQYDLLADTAAVVPRYLFVVHVPAALGRFTEVSPAGLLLRNMGYYLRLSDQGALPAADRRKTVRVRIPTSNVLTAASVRALVAGSAVVPVG